MTTTEETATVVIGSGATDSGSFTGLLVIDGTQIPFKKSPPMKPWGDVMRLGKQLSQIDTKDPDPDMLAGLDDSLRAALGECISDPKAKKLYDDCDALGFFDLASILGDYVKRVNAGVPSLPS